MVRYSLVQDFQEDACKTAVPVGQRSVKVPDQ